MRILFLAHLFPLPLDSGGKIKSYYTLKALAGEHEVMLLAYTRGEDELARIPELEQVCPGVRTVPLARGKVRGLADAAFSLMNGRSFIVSRDFRDEMKREFERAVSEFRPDVVHIDHLQMAQFMSCGGPYKTVLDQHNVESTIIKRVAETSTSLPMRLYAKIEWPKLLRFEIEACRNSDLVLTVSEQDGAALRTLDPGIQNARAVPIGVDVEYFGAVERKPGSRNILSVGTMHWPPNVDSVLYFHDHILPIVRNEIPGCVFTIAGQRPPRSVQALAADPAVNVTGYVDDARKPAADCGVFVVPLRSGSGVRVKILNAMAMGLPIVSTSIGAEGLEVTSGEHLLIADTPEEFARRVIEVLGDTALGERLGMRARELVCEKYSWEVVGRLLVEAYARVRDSEIPS